jgi:hypothetical protein
MSPISSAITRGALAAQLEDGVSGIKEEEFTGIE